MTEPRKHPVLPVIQPLLVGAVLLTLGAGCRPSTPPQRPRGEALRATDWSGLARLGDPTLQKRRRALERELVRRGPRAGEVASVRHRLAAVYLALRLRTHLAATRAGLQLYRVRQHLGKEAIALLEREQRQLHSLALQWLREAAKQWAALLDSDAHRLYRHRDAVLYQVWAVTHPLADSLRKGGQLGRGNGLEATAQRRLVQLLREHPGSPLVPKALLARGDYLRTQRRFGQAMKVFRKVLRSPRAGLHARAYLGLGRSAYDANDLKGARALLGKAVSLASNPAVREQARKAFFKAWTRTGKAAAAYMAFQRLARGRKGFARKLLLALAAWCHDNGREGLANELFREALRRWPRHARRCRWWVAVSQSASALHDWATVRQGMTRLAPLRAELRSAYGPKGDVVRDCDKRAEEHLKSLASRLHARGMRLMDLAMLGTARGAYEVYLAAFPRSKVHYLMAYQHADLLWLMVNRKLGVSDLSWERVATAFERVVRLPKPPAMKRKEYLRKRREAALAVVRGLMRALSITHSSLSSFGPQFPKRPCVKRHKKRCLQRAPLTPLPLPALQKRMVRAYAHYLKLVPKSKYRGAVLFNTAHLYWQHNQFDRALPLFTRIALHHASDMPDAARSSGFRALGILRRLKRNAGYRRLLLKLLGMPRLMRDWSFKRKLRRLHYKLIRQDAERHRKRKQWARCGQLYEKAYAIGRGDAEAARDTYRGAQCLRRAWLPGPAIRMYRAVANHYRSKWRARATLQVARLFERLTFWRRATTWYRRFFDRFPTHRSAPRAALRALRFHALLRQRFRARELLQDIRLRFTVKQPAVVAEATWVVLNTPWDPGHARKKPGLLGRYLKDHRKAGAGDRTLSALVQLAEVLWRRACPVTPTAGRCLSVRSAGPGRGASPARRLRRRAPLVRRAKAHLTQALTLGSGDTQALRIPRDADRRAARLRRVRTLTVRARFLLAEMRSEGQAPPRLPNRLRASKRSLDLWLRRALKKLSSHQASYRALLPVKKQKRVVAAALRVAAAHRMAGPYLSLARRLAAWKPSRAVSKRPAFREALRNTRAALLGQARTRLQQCRKLARRLHAVGPWADRCHADLIRAQGRRPPTGRARWKKHTLPRFRNRPATFAPRPSR